MEFITVNTIKDYTNIVSSIEQAGEVVFDLETTGLDTHAQDIRIVGVGLCCDEQHTYYIPFNDSKQEVTLEDIKQLAENSNIGKIGHNIKYDARVLNRFNIELKNIIFDTLIASYCLDGSRNKHNLDDLTLNNFNHIKIRTKDVIPRKSKKLPNPTMWDSPIELTSTYCCEDCFYTFKLYKLFKSRLDLDKNAYNIFSNIEMPLLNVIIRMECNGVAIDKQKLVDLNNKMEQIIIDKNNLIKSKLNRDIVLTNPNDIAKALYEELKVQEDKAIPVTAKGKYKTDKKTLELFSSNEIVKAIIDVKKLNKLVGTYIQSFANYVSGYTGRLHASFNQTITTTGRL